MARVKKSVSPIYMFKVVRHESNGRNIQSARITLPNLIVNYRTQRWVRPRLAGSKILVFKNLEDAQKFYYRSCEHIYLCEVKNPVPIKAISRFHDDAKAFWDGSYLTTISDEECTPKNTYGCDAVKLLKRIC